MLTAISLFASLIVVIYIPIAQTAICVRKIPVPTPGSSFYKQVQIQIGLMPETLAFKKVVILLKYKVKVILTKLKLKICCLCRLGSD